MKNLVFLFCLFSLVASSQREMPEFNRNGHYRDSAHRYADLWMREKDSAKKAFYETKMMQHRILESRRQWVVDDSGWRTQFHQKSVGWKTYSSGKQSADIGLGKIFIAITNLYNTLFLNNTHIFQFAPGEYVPMDIDVTTATFYAHSGSGIPGTIPSAPANAKIPVGGPHNACGITASGQLWCYGGWVPDGTHYTSGSSAMIQIINDSVGNVIDPVSFATLSGCPYGTFWWLAFVTTTHKLYEAGELEGYNQGNGTWGNAAASRPVQVAPTIQWTKAVGGYFMVGMDTAGAVYTWGGANSSGNFSPQWLGQGTNSPNGKVPTKVTLPVGRRAVDIASNGSYCSFILLDNGDLMASGLQFYEDYAGIPSGTFGNAFIVITSFLQPYLETGHKIKTIGSSSNTIFAILDNGHLYGWGGSPCGEVGGGQMLNFNSSSHGPYFWDFGPHELQVLHPARIAPGVHNFNAIFGCSSNSFYAGFTDSLGGCYGTGRDKGQAQPSTLPKDSSTVIATAAYTNGNISASWPDSWNNPYIQKFHIGWISQNVQITSPQCIKTNNTATSCNTFSPIPTFQAVTGTLAASFVNSKIILSAKGKACANPMTQMLWMQLDTTTAPSKVDMGIQSAVTDTIGSVKDTGSLHGGVYNFLWRGITSHADTAYDSVQIVVNAQGPIVQVSPLQTIFLPQTSTILSCIATAQGGATISSFTWSQLSGPGGATIVSPHTQSTNVSGLVQGGYQFQITVVDSNNNSVSATITVTVTTLNGITTHQQVIVTH